MSKIYLYIKLHRQTGLKYFGRTVRNVHKYLGSGTYWLNHLKAHGSDVVTLRVWEFDDLEACKAFAIKFSRDNCITQSKMWANQIDETGDHSPMHPGANAGDKNPMFGRKHTDEVKQAQSSRLADTNRRSRWYTDGTSSRFTTEPPGPDWKPGRLKHNDGKRWFNNGAQQTFAAVCPPGWVEGPLKFKLRWYTNGVQNVRAESCPEGWRPGLTRA